MVGSGPWWFLHFVPGMLTLGVLCFQFTLTLRTSGLRERFEFGSFSVEVVKEPIL